MKFATSSVLWFIFTLCFSVLGLNAYAQNDREDSVIQLDSSIIWLEPLGSELGVLLANGTVLSMPFANSQILTLTLPTVLATEFLGDSLNACQGKFLGVNRNSELSFINLQAKSQSLSSGIKVAHHARPLCLTNRNIAALAQDAQTLLLFDGDLKLLKSVSVNALPDAELSSFPFADTETIVLLTNPSKRYPHGVLGDELEATELSLFDSNKLDLIANYTLNEPFVFEQRRVLTFEFADASGKPQNGLLATLSSEQTGAGVALFQLNQEGDKGRLELSSRADPIARGFRWLNLFAAKDGFAYAIRTPHIGGPLQSYSLKNKDLIIEDFELGVTNHVIGSRNLDMGVLLPYKQTQTLLAMPAQDLRSIKLISCTLHDCQIKTSFDLEAPLGSNISHLTVGKALLIVAGDSSGKLYSFEVAKEE